MKCLKLVSSSQNKVKEIRYNLRNTDIEIEAVDIDLPEYQAGMIR